MRYSDDVIMDVRQANDIVDVIGEYVILKKKGTNYFGLCPFHGEKTPSFSVNREKQIFHCFGCGVGGGVFKFIELQESLSFTESLEFLANRINYKLPDKIVSQDDLIRQETKEKLWELHKAAARFFYECLVSDLGKPATDYLNMRGVSNAARIKFGIGYAPDSWNSLNDHLLKEGFPQELIAQSGLVKQGSSGKYYDRFRNRVMFPIIDISGHVIAFGGRRLSENKEEAKYLNSPDTEIFSKSYNPYNLNLARQGHPDEFILVEGYMDVISLYQAGFKNAIAACGTAFNEKHAGVIKRFTHNIIALFDSDNAGENAALKAIPVLKNAGINMKILQVPNAKDPDEYINNFGAEAFGKLIKTAVNPMLFRINVLKKQLVPDNPDSVILFTQKVTEILSETDNLSELDIYINTAIKDTPVSAESLRSDIRRIKGMTDDPSDNSRTYARQYKNTAASGAVEEAKSTLINIIANDKLLFQRLDGVFSKEEFDDDMYVRLFDIVERAHKKDAPITAADLLTLLEPENPEYVKRAEAVLWSQLPYTNAEQRHSALLSAVKIIKTAHVDSLMRKTEDDELMSKLIDEKRNIENSLKALTI